ncbi:acyltransferase family-domain-containing protein [Halenospora varia]|nr:acyltransferase family-domain-containing protein [Halenospora varia]
MSREDPEKQSSPLLDEYHDIESVSGPSSPSLEDKTFQQFTLDAGILSNQVYDSLGNLYRSTSNNTGKTGFFLALFPSFLRAKDESKPKRRLYPTSYLDGLRGVAAFIVWFHHFVVIWAGFLMNGWGSLEEGSNHILQWPFIRIVYSGRGMVTIFFIISGYVLSYKSLRQIRNRQFEGLLDTLASATFRRGLRLFLPIAASTFLTLIVFRMGYYVAAPTNPTEQPTLFLQIYDWFWNMVLLSNPTDGIDGNSVYADPYGYQLWTIPREFRGSFVIYLTLLGLAKTTQVWRLITLTSMVSYCLYVVQWDLFLFLIGMLFAEFQFVREDPNMAGKLHALSRFVPQSVLKNKKTIMHTITISMAILGVHMLTFPDELASTSPGFYWMHDWTPEQYDNVALIQKFWLCMGSVLLVLAMNFSPGTSSNPAPVLQRLFTTRFAQYLANISYSMYILHNIVLYTVVCRMYWYWRDMSIGWYTFGFVESLVVYAMISFWLADVFWRLVDDKSIALAKWVADKCFVE